VAEVADDMVNDVVMTMRPQEDVAESISATHDSWVASNRADLIAISILVFLTGIALWLRFVYDNWLSDADIFVFFLPWFGYVGERLGNFELPIWSTSYLSGTPVIGSPSSGWMYLPVMVLFPLLSVVTAFKTLVLVQVVIAGSATYALSRRIGLGPTAALMSTSAFVLGPFLYTSTRSLVISGQTNTWIPVGVLAAEMALRAGRISSILGWSALISLALTQIFAAWPSQGILYSTGWIGGWILFRTVFDPVDKSARFKDRWIRAVFCGVSIVVLFLSFSAAVSLPLFEINKQSTIPNGDYSEVLGGDYSDHGLGLTRLLYNITSDDFYTRTDAVGGSVLILAAIGLLFARRKFAVPFFATVFLIGLSLTVKGSPTVELFNLIPYFERLHGHRPSGILWVLPLAPAMLAGAAVQQLLSAKDRLLPVVPIIECLFVLFLGVSAISSIELWIGWWPILTMILTIFLFALPSLELSDIIARWRVLPRRIVTAALVAGIVLVFGAASVLTSWSGWWLLGTGAAFVVAYWLPTLELPLELPPWARTWRPDLTRIAAAGLIGIVFLFPTGVDVLRTVANPETPPGGWTQHLGKDEPTERVVDTVLARKDPGTAAEFLQTQRELRAPFRYTGYSGQGYPTDEYREYYNTFYWRRMEPGVVGILMNVRTLRLDLEQTSGYNPVQFRHYADYIDVMNNARQDYHWADTYANALFGSQLLNMLNVRYIVVDAAIPETRTDFIRISQTYQEVYRDNLAIVYENPRAFPRAWLVHVVRPNNDGDGLELLADGSVDGRFVAFVDGPVPPVTIPPGAGRRGSVPGEQVVVTASAPESMTIQATAVTDGLLVVSAAHAEGWNAYVDGERVEILRTNHALQGVPLPAGEHVVELKYEPRSLTIGLRVTGAASVAMIGIWAWALVDWRHTRRRKLTS